MAADQTVACACLHARLQGFCTLSDVSERCGHGRYVCGMLHLQVQVFTWCVLLYCMYAVQAGVIVYERVGGVDESAGTLHRSNVRGHMSLYPVSPMPHCSTSTSLLYVDLAS